MTPMSVPKREVWIDIVKIIASLFVLLNHLEVKIPVVSQFGGMFYVPVFFVAAGYTMRPYDAPYRDFVKKKAKRLLIPYFLYSLFLLLVFTVKDGFSLQSLAGIFYARNCIYPLGTMENPVLMNITNSPMWFLPALFLSELAFELLRKSEEKVFGIRMICCTVIGLFVIRLCPVLLPWSLECIPVFAGMLGAGYWLRKNDTIERCCKKPLYWLILTGLLYLLYRENGAINISVGEFGKYEAQGFMTAVLSSLLIMLLCRRFFGGDNTVTEKWKKRLEMIAGATLDIMCLHMFLFMLMQGGMHALLPAVRNIWEDGGTVSMVMKILAAAGTMVFITAGRFVFGRFVNAGNR